MSKKVLKLDFQNDFEFLVAGIVSGARDYRLCFELNELLRIDLKRKEDVVISAGKPGSSTRHSHFISPGRDNEYYHIINNRDKDGTGYVIPEMKNIDYYLVIANTPMHFELKKLVKQMWNLDIVTGVYETDPADLKSADAFLLFVES